MAIRLSRKNPRCVEPAGVGASSGSAESPVSLELLSIKQAAAFAGVAPVTIRRWVRQRLLPAYRAGVQIRIDRTDLIKFIRYY